MEFYVVGVLHSTGHGENIAIVQVTRDPFIAVRTALDIEKLGYRFNSETGVNVYRLELDRLYSKAVFKLFKCLDTLATEYPVIFSRSKYCGVWENKWHDPDLERQFTLINIPS